MRDRKEKYGDCTLSDGGELAQCWLGSVTRSWRGLYILYALSNRGRYALVPAPIELANVNDQGAVSELNA